MQFHNSALLRLPTIGLRHLKQQIRYRLAIALLGKSASARIMFAEFLQGNASYKGPIFKMRNRTLVACGDHYLWTLTRDTGVGQGLLKHGAWQRDDFDTALRLILDRNGRMGKAFVDVGANIGTHSIYAALSGYFDRVIAIEPEPRNAAILRDNFSLNDIPIHLDIVQKAVGGGTGPIYLSLHETDSGMHSVTTERGDRSIEVALDTLPNILDQLRVPPEDIGFLWMDAEGHEFDVFKATDALFSRRVPIFFEYGKHTIGDQHAYWANKFKSFGYDCWVMQRGHAHKTDIASALGIEFGNILLI
jgi:FkbM family methyltransferase